MRHRLASINDLPIAETDRLFRWPLGPRPAGSPGALRARPLTQPTAVRRRGTEKTMGHRFAELAFTPKVKAFQEQLGSRRGYARMESGEASHAALGPREAAFIAERDSFYMASVSETGWPYVQHRGGPPGFVRVLDDKTLGFADFRGQSPVRQRRQPEWPTTACRCSSWTTRTGRGSSCSAARKAVEPNEAELLERARPAGLPGAGRARHPDPRRSLRLELPAAHHAALHGSGDRAAGAGLRRGHEGPYPVPRTEEVMKLHNSIGPNPRAVRIFLAEKGLAVPLVQVDLMAGENRREPYLPRTLPGSSPASSWTTGASFPRSRPFASTWRRSSPNRPS